MLREQLGATQPAQRLHHQQITSAESAIEPIRAIQFLRQGSEPNTYWLFDERQSLRKPWFVPLHEYGTFTVNDHRLYRRYSANIQAMARARAWASSGRSTECSWAM